MKTKVKVSCKKNQLIDYDGAYRKQFPERIEEKSTFAGTYKLDKEGNIIITRKKSNSDDAGICCLPSNTSDIIFYINEEHAYAEVVSTLQDAFFSFVIMLDEDLNGDSADDVLDFFATLQVHAEKAGVDLHERIDPNPIGICPDDVENMDELRERYDTGVALETPIDLSFTKEDEPTNVIDELFPDTDSSSPSETTDDITDSLRKIVERSTQRINELTARNDEDLEVGEAEENEVMKNHAEVGRVIHEAISGLENVKQNLVDTKQRRIDEINRIIASDGADDDDDIFDVAKIQGLADATIQNFDASSDTNDSNSYDLTAERSQLAALANDISAQLDDYDTVLKRSRKEQDDLIKDIDNMDHPTDETVSDLLALLNEQTLHNEQLNEAMKKERIRHEHHLKQLEASNKRVAELSGALDEVKRRLRFSQENQRKAGEFVQSCRETTGKIVAEAQSRIDAAIKQTEEMRAKVDQANQQAATEKANAEAMASQRDKALIDRDAAIANLNKEKRHAARLVNEFSSLIDEFTAETIDRINDQIGRADRAEQRLTTASKRINDVENELNDVRKMLFAAEAQLSRHEHDMQQADQKLEDKTAECSDLQTVIDAEVNARTELQARYDELMAKYETSESNYRDLAIELEQAKQECSAVRTEKMQAINEMQLAMDSEIARVYEDRDASVSSLIEARDEALAANKELVTTLASVALMPSSFGHRANKIEAFNSAYDAFVKRQREAEDISKDVVPAFTGAHSVAPAVTTIAGSAAMDTVLDDDFGFDINELDISAEDGSIHADEWELE